MDKYYSQHVIEFRGGNVIVDWSHSLWGRVSPSWVQVRMTTVLLKSTYALAPPPRTFE